MTGSSARSIRGTMAAASAPAVEIDTQGFPVVAVEVAGTFVQTLIVEETISGDNWVTAQSFDATSAAVSATITAPGRCFVNSGGRSGIRVRQTAFTSGTATVVMDTGEGIAAAASGGGGGGGGAVTVADGADVAQGTTTDAAAGSDTATATIVAFWKRLLSRLTTLLPQTANGLKVDNSAVTQPVSGTFWQAAQAVTVADGADGAEGATTDAANTTGTTGTISGKLRGLVAILADVWNSSLHFLRVGGASAVGTAPGTNPVSIAGWDGTNKQHLKLNSDGTPAVGGFTVAVNATFTRPANTTTYTANTGVANATSAASQLTFTGAARFSGGSGVILGASLLDEANQTLKGQFELWLFDTTIGTIINDNANWAPANADLANLVGIIPVNTSYVGNNGSGASGNVVFESGLINFPFKCNGSANLFGMLVVRNAYVPVSAETFICRLLVSCD